MKPIKYTFFILLFFTLSCSEEQAEPTAVTKSEKIVRTKTRLSQEQLEMLKPGDIILRRGDGSLSDHIIKMMNENNNISHCGIIIRDGGKWKVVHALGGPTAEQDGIQVENINSFVGKTVDNTIYIARPIFHDSAAYLIPKYALEFAEQNISFDYSFNLETDDRFGCTELLYKTFKKITDEEIFEIEVMNGFPMLHFTTFFDDKKFTKVLDLRNENTSNN